MNMGRMNEQSQQEEERENLSGSDDYEAWINSMETEFKAAQQAIAATDDRPITVNKEN